MGTPFRTFGSHDAVWVKKDVRQAVAGYTSMRHEEKDRARFLIHVDGGGARTRRDGAHFPATWAVLVTSVGLDGTRLFYHFACGKVATDPASPDYVGLRKPTP